MWEITQEQVQVYRSMLNAIRSTNGVYQFLKEDTDAMYDHLAQALTPPQQVLLKEFIDALEVLCLHGEFLAYQVGLGHGRYGWSPS